MFSDESGVDGSNRYQAICTISGRREDMRVIHKELKVCLLKHQCSEIKFSKIKGGLKYFNCAKDFIDVGLRRCYEGLICVEVMVWDIYDSRHAVKGRDDGENFSRMYYHCLKSSVKNWQAAASWELYPDENSLIDWPKLSFYLSRTNFAEPYKEAKLLFEELRQLKLQKIHPPKPSSSSKFFIIQLADLFAGIVRTSHSEGQKLIDWRKAKDSKSTFFPIDYDLAISNNQKAKYEVMSHFKDKAEELSLGVNLSKCKYFKTFNKSKNIFLWKYEPQYENDKAPTK